MLSSAVARVAGVVVVVVSSESLVVLVGVVDVAIAGAGALEVVETEEERFSLREILSSSSR